MAGRDDNRKDRRDRVLSDLSKQIDDQISSITRGNGRRNTRKTASDLDMNLELDLGLNGFERTRRRNHTTSEMRQEAEASFAQDDVPDDQEFEAESAADEFESAADELESESASEAQTVPEAVKSDVSGMRMLTPVDSEEELTDQAEAVVEEEYQDDALEEEYNDEFLEEEIPGSDLNEESISSLEELSSEEMDSLFEEELPEELSEEVIAERQMADPLTAAAVTTAAAAVESETAEAEEDNLSEEDGRSADEAFSRTGTIPNPDEISDEELLPEDFDDEEISDEELMSEDFDDMAMGEEMYAQDDAYYEEEDLDRISRHIDDYTDRAADGRVSGAFAASGRSRRRSADRPADRVTDEEILQQGVENTKNEKKKFPLKRVLSILAAGAALALIVIGVTVIYPAVKENREKTDFYTTHFLSGTTINGVDVSDKTPDEAEAYIKDTLNDYHLNILTREGETLSLSGEQISMISELDVDFDSFLAKQDPAKWKEGATEAFTTKAMFEYDETKLSEWYKAAEYFNRTDRVENQPMVIRYADGQYQLVQMVQGNRIDPAKMYEVLKGAVDTLKTDIDLKDSEGYIDPLLPVPTEETLAKAQETVNSLNEYVKTKITYDLGDGITEVVDGELINKCLSLDEQNNVKVDTAPLSEWIAEMATKYNTLHKTRSFTTHSGSVVSVPAGTFGWDMDQTTSLSELAANIEKKEDVTTDFAWNQEGVSHTANDWGSTYCEVDLNNQILYVYVNGGVAFSTYIVSGKGQSPGLYTPEGMYYIFHMEKNHIMKGQLLPNGKPEYETNAEWWMNFIPSIGVGFHDAPWQPTFGGDWYLLHGSHGCINMAPGDARTLYENYAYVGMPVITYGGVKTYGTYVPGTTAAPPETTPTETETPSETQTSEQPTDPTTSPTVAPTQPTAAPTQPPTEPPTQPTEPPTQPTEPPTQPSSEEPVTQPSSEEPVTQPSSEEPVTEPASQPEQPTETVGADTPVEGETGV